MVCAFQERRDRISRLRISAIISLVVTTMATSIVTSQPLAAQEPSREVKGYGLKHAAATKIHAQLTELISDAFPNAQLGIDVEGNRVLLSGSEAAQQVVAQFISAIDKPAKPPLAEQSGAKPELRPYEVAPEKLQATRQSIAQALKAHANVRVMADDRTNQILVMASPAIHRWIAAQMRSGALQNPVQSSIRIGKAPPNSVVRQSAKLEHISTQNLESALRDFVRGKLNVQRSSDKSQVTITMPSHDGRHVLLRVDDKRRVIEAQGPSRGVRAWLEAIRAIDTPRTSPNFKSKLLALGGAHRPSVRQAVAHLEQDGKRTAIDRNKAPADNALLNRKPPLLIAQADLNTQANDENAKKDDSKPNGDATAKKPDVSEDRADGPLTGGLVGDVKVEYMEGSDLIAISGHDRDVQRMVEIINRIQDLSIESVPSVQIVPLTHVNSSAMSDLVNQLYADVYEPRQGPVSITGLVKPNSLLLIGREENVNVIVDLVKRLDQPVDPASQFHVFRLKHVPAASAEQTLQSFFGGDGGEQRRSVQPEGGQGGDAKGDNRGLAVRIRVTADVRSNSLIVRSSPRDLGEVQRLIRKIDVETSAVVNRVEIFQLKNSRAEELAPVLQQAISGQNGQGRGQQQRRPDSPEFGSEGGRPRGGRNQAQSRSAMLTFSRIGPEGERILQSGIMSDVRVSADAATNSLIVTAPERAMQLIFALIERLDQLPSTEARIKVFQLENGDATAMRELLEELFPPPTEAGQPGGRSASGDSSLVPLKFSVDQRTNSIIASGSPNDLTVARAIIINLDSSEVRERSNEVYRLRYANAAFVANAIQEFLRSEQQRTQQQIQAFTQNGQGSVGPFEQIEREVVVVAEDLTNTLIISATPRFRDQIMEIVEEIDAVPPMVMIQVMIAEVELNDTAEFGVELGIQDSLLFDRGSVLGGAIGQSALTAGETVAGQGLTSFALGRANSELGFGGLVLSAGNESISILMRALQEERRLEVLSRPQIMTLDNQPARIQVGADVRIASGTNVTLNGLTNLETQPASIGLILDVVPRISPDGTVFMFLRAEKSALGPEASGTPIAISDDGLVVRSPRINITLAETSISVPNGQTAVFSGLLTQETSETSRQVPVLGDIPLLGDFFRYDQVAQRRTELIIILTPHIVHSQDDLARINHTESSRMSWCLADVTRMHGDMHIVSQQGYAGDSDVMTVFPDGQPNSANYGAAGVYSGGESPLPLNGSQLTEPQLVAPPLNRADPPLPAIEPPTIQAPVGPSARSGVRGVLDRFDIRQRFARRSKSKSKADGNRSKKSERNVMQAGALSDSIDKRGYVRPASFPQAERSQVERPRLDDQSRSTLQPEHDDEATRTDSQPKLVRSSKASQRVRSGNSKRTHNVESTEVLTGLRRLTPTD